MEPPKTTIPNGDESPVLQWPFSERRQGGDRRVGDRRKGERRQGDRRAKSSASIRDPAPSFTARERQIVDLLMQGMTNRQIAQALGNAEATVKKHLLHIYRKLGVRSRTLLIIEQNAKKQ